MKKSKIHGHVMKNNEKYRKSFYFLRFVGNLTKSWWLPPSLATTHSDHWSTLLLHSHTIPCISVYRLLQTAATPLCSC